MIIVGVFCLSGGEGLDQAVRDIKRVVENLEDIKHLLQVQSLLPG